MEGEMPKTVAVPVSIAPLMWRLSRAVRRLLVDAKQSSPIVSPDLMKRFELLLQCGF
jgi:hypothetical protein